MERRGQKTLYEKTSRASVSYIRGKEADIGWGKKLARKLNGPGREISRKDSLKMGLATGLATFLPKKWQVPWDLPLPKIKLMMMGTCHFSF